MALGCALESTLPSLKSVSSSITWSPDTSKSVQSSRD
ncbi:hypothetical protein LINPERPRIM_LOCUS4387 [Linum perenne]